MATTHVRVTAEDRRQQIIEVARELFSAQGYQGTTTRELAEAVGINEALLFRHFSSKEDLYWAVLQHMIEVHSGKDRIAECLRSGMPEREALLAIAGEILNRNHQLVRLLFFSALERHELADRFFRTHVIAYHEIVAEYIREGIAAGRFRKVDPLLSARAFIGMVAYHSQLQDLFGGRHFHSFSNEQVASQLVDIWLQGMQPINGRLTSGHRVNGREAGTRSVRGKKSAEKVTK